MTIAIAPPGTFKSRMRAELVSLFPLWTDCLAAAAVVEPAAAPAAGRYALTMTFSRTPDGVLVTETLLAPEGGADPSPPLPPAVHECFVESTYAMTFDTFPEGVDHVDLHDTIAIDGRAITREGMSITYRRP